MDMIVTDFGAAKKFNDAAVTTDGEPRASVDLRALNTLWLNTGTLCNLTCESCYIESSPTNDRLAYLTRADVAGYLQEITERDLPVREIGITGGEPFMNPDIVPIVADCLATGVQVLVLTNAMRPMLMHSDALLELKAQYGEQLVMRVSVDHFDRAKHEQERGKQSWTPMVRGLQWLCANDFAVHIAGRTRWGESEPELRSGFAGLFKTLGLTLDASDPQALILFPEMDERVAVPEITTACWGILNVNPADMMCASARMVVRRRGAATPEVVACTLLPYEPEFSYGMRLVDSLNPVPLNHVHCAKFCVLGGGSCSG